MGRAERRAARSLGLSRRMDAAALAEEGRWNARFRIPLVAVHSIVLPTGKLLWYSNKGPGLALTSTAAYLWDPASGRTKRVDPPANVWCGGQSFLADGRLLVAGGTVTGRRGLNKLYTFNPFNETWTEQPDMRRGRWYPTQVLRPDGTTVIMDGLDETAAATNPDIEVFTPSPDPDGRGTLQLQSQRAGAGSPPSGGLYPHLFSMPSGRTLVAGPDVSDSWFMNPAGASPVWTDAANPAETRKWGSAVLLPAGRPGASSQAMLLGGSATPLDSTEVFDENAPGTGWRAGPALNAGRSHHNTVLLPDGSMVTVGGGFGERPGAGEKYATDTGTANNHRRVELFDPQAARWLLGPAQTEDRAYHSTAVMLPDGRVLSAGDERNGDEPDTAEIYEPPYLFKGPRPTIAAAPEALMWGWEFRVSTPDPVSRAVLMAPAATTHGNDMSQRHVELEVTGSAAGQGLSLRAPASANVAPPAYYMLFLLSDRGVPSVAKWVRLGSVGTPAQAGFAPEGSSRSPAPTGRPRAHGPRVLLRRRNLRVRITVREPATVDLRARLGLRRRDRPTRRIVLRRQTVRFRRAGTKTVTLGVSRSVRRLARAPGSRRMALTLTAVDAAGNRTTLRRAWKVDLSLPERVRRR